MNNKKGSIKISLDIIKVPTQRLESVIEEAFLKSTSFKKKGAKKDAE